MNYKKIILIGIGLIVAGVLAFYIVSFLSSILLYLFVAGILFVGGAIGYKLLTRPKQKRLAEKQPLNEFARAEATMEDSQKLLDNYKSKLLVEKKSK